MSPVDRDVVRRKLTRIAKCLERMREVRERPLEDYLANEDLQFIMERQLELAIGPRWTRTFTCWCRRDGPRRRTPTRRSSSWLATRTPFPMGRVTDKLGRLVEDIIGPSVPATFSALFGVPEGEQTSGIRWHRPHRSRPGSEREFDAIAAGGDVFLVVGVRSTQTPEAVAEFASGLPEVRDYFPEWTEGRRILGAVASFTSIHRSSGARRVLASTSSGSSAT